MSTKTTIKRIALVAAVAAAFGGLSTVAANATYAGTLPVVTNSSTAVAALANSATETTTVTANNTVGTYNAVSLTPGMDDSYYTITTSGVGTVSYPATAPTGTTLSASSATTEIWSSGSGAIGAVTPGSTAYFGSNVAASGDNYNALTVSVYSATAGTQTITFAGNNSTTITETITWGAASAASAANSTLYATTASTSTYPSSTTATTATAVSSALNGSNAPVLRAVADLNIFDQYATSGGLTGQAVTITVSGPGSVSTQDASITPGTTSPSLGSAPLGRAITTAALTHSTLGIGLWSDGTAGTSTVTVSVGTTVLGSFSVIFYGTTPATITATQNLKVAAAGTRLGDATDTAASGAVTITAKDANGNLVGGLGTSIGSTSSVGWFATSSNTACISSGVTNAYAGDAAASTDDTVGQYELTVTAAGSATSGCTAQVVFSYYDSSTLTLSTAPITFSVGGTTIAALTLTPDSNSYVPGQEITLTLTAKDSSGNPVADGDYGIWYNGAAAAANSKQVPLTSNFGLTSNPFEIDGAASGTEPDLYYAFVGGVSTATTYAPVTDGTVNLTSTLATAGSGLATALQDTTLATSFDVTSGSSAQASAATDAANEATDAANAATDAANAAADAADAATQAAQDASAQAQAALAAVNALSAQITVLAAQIAKIVKKIKA